VRCRRILVEPNDTRGQSGPIDGEGTGNLSSSRREFIKCYPSKAGENFQIIRDELFCRPTRAELGRFTVRSALELARPCVISVGPLDRGDGLYLSANATPTWDSNAMLLSPILLNSAPTSRQPYLCVRMSMTMILRSRSQQEVRMSAVAPKAAVEDLIAKVIGGKALEAFDRYYADDVTMQENEQPPRVGKAACRASRRTFFLRSRRYAPTSATAI
jgi:hypothetical protein